MDYKNTKLLLMINRVKTAPSGYDYPFVSTFSTNSDDIEFSHSGMEEDIKHFENAGNEFSANKLRTEYQAIINYHEYDNIK